MSEVLYDDLIQTTLVSSLHRRNERQIYCVSALLDNVQECRVEVSSCSTILTADQGYAKASFMDLIWDVSVSITLIILELLVSTHTSLGESHMDTARQEFPSAKIDRCEDENTEYGALGSELFQHAGIGTGLSGERPQLTLQRRTRISKFIISDAGNLCVSYVSTKRSSVSPRNPRCRACNVREAVLGGNSQLIPLPYDLSYLLAHKELASVAHPVDVNGRDLYSMRWHRNRGWSQYVLRC